MIGESGFEAQASRIIVSGYIKFSGERAVATAGIYSNVDVCEKAKHHTELFW